MITSALGYRCLNVMNPDLSRFITGDILPVRIKRNDGSWRAKKYEDMLFLREAFLERMATAYPQKYPVDASVAPYGRICNFQNFLYSVFNPYVNSGFDISGTTYFDHFVDPDKSTTFDFIDVDDYPIDDELRNLGWTYFTYEEGKILNNFITIEDAFWFTKRLKRGLYGCNFSDLYTCVYTETLSGGSYDGYSTYDEGPWNGTLYKTEYDPNGIKGSENIRVSFSANSPSVFSRVRWMAPASSGRVSVWLYRCRGTHFVNGSKVDEKTKLVSRPVVNGKPVTDMNLFISQLASACGYPYSQTPYHSERDTYELKVLDVYLIIEHEFPAEIDSLNWNYVPNDYVP